MVNAVALKSFVFLNFERIVATLVGYGNERCGVSTKMTMRSPSGRARMPPPRVSIVLQRNYSGRSARV